MPEYLIGLDFGSAAARGVLVDVHTGLEVASHSEDYRHGTLTTALPDGTPLARGWALQVAQDYLDAVAAILTRLGKARRIVGMGVGFTASSPMPTDAAGTPLSALFPDDPHAYVKLWKHAAQRQADRINKQGGDYLNHFGGKLSGEWLLPKAAQIAEEAPASWVRTARFIEAGDWLVWQLVGSEVRSLGMAAYKAQYNLDTGYPDVIEGLSPRLSDPQPIGSKAGDLSTHWQALTGIIGPCAVAVAVIDSHVVLPAVGAVEDGCFVAALGTSSVSLMLSHDYHPLPTGIEGTALDGSIRGLWCYEAGQACFGDMLSWYVTNFPRGRDAAESFAAYNSEAAKLQPGQNRLIALDWWSGNRVPHANSALSGLLVGLTMQSDAVSIYRALIESLCYGMRQVFELYQTGGFHIRRVVMTSGLAMRNPFLVQTMAHVLGRSIEVPNIENSTAVGAAVHGAVACNLVSDFTVGAARFGAKSSTIFDCDSKSHAVYSSIFRHYQSLSHDPNVLAAMESLAALLQVEVDPMAKPMQSAGS